jgi:hypothetical protein
MKNLVKLSIAGGLALGSVAAHAGITVGTSSGSTGDVVLFADIFNGSTLVAAYAGDTGAHVDDVGSGTKPTSTFEDANLTSFLSKATAGTTVLWAVEGAGNHAGPAPYVVTSAPNLNAVGTQTGSTLVPFITALTSQAQNVNGLIGAGATPNANSWLGTDDSYLTGNGFNPTAAANSMANWQGASASYISSTGLGTVATLYTLSAADQRGVSQATETAELGVSLTANGLVYSTLGGGGGGPAVPLPAAVWLLGSGLLGLAGVGRRKSAA